MVSTVVLQQERAEALSALRGMLGSLTGADAQRMQETAERSGSGLIGRDYETALCLREAVAVLADQQRRIEELEAKSSPGPRARKRSRGSSA